MTTDYFIGDATRLSLSVIDGDTGNLVDPGGLVLKLRPPGGPVTEHIYAPGSGTIVRDGVGLFHAQVPLHTHGRWYFHWKTTAPNVGAAEGSLQVLRTRFP